jgi:RimJ/RimL family protein N-acetyltransferase
MLIPNYPIQTARLKLRPFQDDDLGDLFEFYSLPEVAKFLYWDAKSLDETKTNLERKKSEVVMTEEGSTLCLAVSLRESNKVIGEVLLFWRSQVHQQGEVGYVFHPGYSGRGYATEATKVMLSLGFDQLSLHRIYGRCDARNVASYKVMERLGMRREAHFIQNEVFKGEWGEELVYAMLQQEWQDENKVD